MFDFIEEGNITILLRYTKGIDELSCIISYQKTYSEDSELDRIVIPSGDNPMIATIHRLLSTIFHGAQYVPPHLFTRVCVYVCVYVRHECVRGFYVKFFHKISL